jgi:DNA-binding Xre family transcriptional regulator
MLGTCDKVESMAKMIQIRNVPGRERMGPRSDIDDALEEQRRRPDWPTERALITDFAIQIAMIFEKLREQQGLSYQELADKAGTSKAHVIRLLSGTYAGISNRSIAKLCKALGCELTIQQRPTHAPVFARTGRRAAS